jgi:hypothetical protein
MGVSAWIAVAIVCGAATPTIARPVSTPNSSLPLAMERLPVYQVVEMESSELTRIGNKRVMLAGIMRCVFGPPRIPMRMGSARRIEHKAVSVGIAPVTAKNVTGIKIVGYAEIVNSLSMLEALRPPSPRTLGTVLPPIVLIRPTAMETITTII